MNFLIADTFPAAMRKLTAQEQKAVKTTVFDLQLDPAHPGLQFHRIDKSKDENFWSIRVNRDIRVIIHKTQSSVLVCYVDHHDDAYKWAERRRIETHPRTGAAQIVEVRERVEEILVQKPVEVLAAPEPALPPLFAGISDDELLDYGVPEDWLDSVKAATEDTLFDLSDHLPSEASEALLDLAVGQKPEVIAAPAEPTIDPFQHPDAQRRFRVMDNVDELKRALDFPWDQWTVFLHPSQRSMVEQSFGGPARVSGSAGTGKTVVAIHRTASILKREPEAKVLLTTFSLPLANALEAKLKILTGEDSRVVPHVSVLPFKGVAQELFTLAFGHDPRPAKTEQIRSALNSASEKLGVSEFPVRFLMSEWQNVVDAWQVSMLDEYRDVPRLGRKNRLGSKQRERLWPIYEEARKSLEAQGILTWPEIFKRVADYFRERDHKPFTHAIVDEAQDLGVPELRMLAAIVPQSSNSLFFAGDLGQRIFQEPFSWKTLGIDVRGRSKTLKVNYRTSHQIRQSADKLLPSTVRDVDGNEQDRRGTVSVFNGPAGPLKTETVP
ncbi:MAG: UvrD-helicase domain-containing protein, partial [Pseudomonadota bacterium]